MVSFATLKSNSDSTDQVRKVLEGLAFLAPETAEPVTSITDTDGSLKALPETYIPVGLVSRDGFTFTAETETAEVQALGYASPVREDIINRTRSIAFTGYEVFRAPLLSLAYGIDLSEVEKNLSGEVTWDHPTLPNKTFYRLVVIGKDGSAESEIYRAKFFPRVAITEMPEEVWGGDDALVFNVTLRAYVDDELGTAERDFISGPGAKSDTELGFTAGV